LCREGVRDHTTPNQHRKPILHRIALDEVSRDVRMRSMNKLLERGMSNTKRTIFVADRLHYLLKLSCAQRRMPMTKAVDEAVGGWLRAPVNVDCEGDRQDRTRNVFMEDATHRALKLACAERRVRMTDVVEHALQGWLEEHPVEGDGSG